METEKEMTAIQKTQVYLENYREIERYIKDAISEVSQIDDVSRYNISAEKAFLQSIRECKAETVILFEHMKKALASLKEDAEAAGEGYKFCAAIWAPILNILLNNMALSDIRPHEYHPERYD